MEGRFTLVELLKGELEFVNSGGFKHCPRSPWCAPHNFNEYSTCQSVPTVVRADVCQECALMQFIAPEHREEEIPCRFVQLTTSGVSVDWLCRHSTPVETERTLRFWIEQRIRQLERDRGQTVVNSK